MSRARYPSYVALSIFLAVSSCLIMGVRADSGRDEEDTWAVLVCTSRYWFNYRHVANTLAMYRTVKRLGVPDDHIVLMLAEDVACNTRTTLPGQVFDNDKHDPDVYGCDVSVDYRGYEVTVHNFLRVLTGKHDPTVPLSKKLSSTANSNVLVYMTGHGGNGFLKFQNQHEINSLDFAHTFQFMQDSGRYKRLLFLVDSCEASSLSEFVTAPHILSVASSQVGESSLSYYASKILGVPVADRFTSFALEFMEERVQNAEATTTLQELLAIMTPSKLSAHYHASYTTEDMAPSKVVVEALCGASPLDALLSWSDVDSDSLRVDVSSSLPEQYDQLLRGGTTEALDGSDASSMDAKDAKDAKDGIDVDLDESASNIIDDKRVAADSSLPMRWRMVLGFLIFALLLWSRETAWSR